jgi:protein phosphatase PTC7
MFVSVLTKRSCPAVKNAFKLGRTRSFSFSSFNFSSNSHSRSNEQSSSAGNWDSVNQQFDHYNIAVAFQPKDREESNLFKKNSNKVSPALLSPSGEDNLFVLDQKQGYISVGVADGVGGWSEAGYDSSAISRELCSEMKSVFESCGEYENLTPKQMLQTAFKLILTSPKVEIGGTTACLGILTPENTIRIANLGDSWAGLFRDYKCVEQTNFQTHNFNTPYQLAKIPEQIMNQAKAEGRRYIVDSPDLAEEYEWKLQPNDIIMFATDGVTDNVVTEDIEIFLKDRLDVDSPQSLTEISKTFVKEVVKVSKDLNFPSSFAQELSKLTGQKYLGGKEDDITVVIVQVK